MNDSVIDKARSAATPWDAIWSVVDDLTSDHDLDIDSQIESGLTSLIMVASDADLIDRELHIEATARWILALVCAYRTLMEKHTSLDPDTEIATMRLIISRYLRPARPGV